ncbi:MAG TPA: phenylalanine--tRNA ligase subunit beta [Vicinamibacterales bacterium]|nr:phenylalanine--tRNA ligase subunit beta [Vicinamibacterales bacterium]
MKIVLPWLRDWVQVPGDADEVARELSLRGFEVAAVEHGRLAVIDFEITANRPDCMSHVGLAREASAIWGLPLEAPPEAEPASSGPAERLDVVLEDPDLCPRYCAQVFEVRTGPSPAWLGERLEAAGIRPINNVVDVTNYVMLDLGQPLHAFDLERLAGRTLVIRRGRRGERLQTLDGVERQVDPDMLIIADAERAAAIGGVMGGAASEVGPGTGLIALESAYFHPASVRRTSKRLGLKTEASLRFERGADIAAPPAAIARAAALMARIGAGVPRGPLTDRYPSPRAPVRLRLRAAGLARLLGQEIPAPDVPRFLEPLGFTVEPARDAAGPGWIVGVPTWRVDVSREADLVEDVGRHYGYDRLPVTFPALTAPQPQPDPRIGRERLVRRVLTSAGFSDAMTFAFIERQAAQPFCTPGSEPIPIANPLSEKFAVLRPSILPGLLDACAHNRRRERRDVRLFETGSRFTGDGEGRAAAFLWCGAAVDPHWSLPARTVDFFDARGVVEQICAAFGIEPDFRPAERSFLVRGRTAEVLARVDGSMRTLGSVGQLAPDVAEARGFPPSEEIYAAELDLEAIAAGSPGGDLRAELLPRYPSIVRDLSILVDEVLPAAAVRGTIRSAAPATLVSVVEFDRYRGQGVPQGRVSLSFRLTFRATDRTLTDREADEATSGVLAALAAAHGAERR